jgi:hypothetical protein
MEFVTRLVTNGRGRLWAFGSKGGESVTYWVTISGGLCGLRRRAKRA